MKKLLPIAFGVAVSLSALHLQAQEKSTLYYYDEIVDEMLLGGGLKNTSPNGKYAVGFDDTFMETGYMWDATSKKLTMIDAGDGETAFAEDVNNDGTILGAFADAEGMFTPGYYKDGKWHGLPLPAETKEVRRKDNDYAPLAQAFSADGKVIGGTVYYNDGYFRPVLWIDGELKEFTDIKVEGQGFYLYDINKDGSMIAGWVENFMGERLPAIIVDGKMKILYEPDMELEDRNFVESVASHIDQENNVTGYIIDEDGITHGFMYNEKDGFKYVSDGLISCSLNHNCIFGSTGYMGTATIIRDGKEMNLLNILGIETKKLVSNVMACSDDASLLVGMGVQGNEMGIYSVPFVIEVSQEGRDLITSLKQQNWDKVSVSISTGGQLFVTGSYTGVEVYNTLGSCVAKDNQQGHIVNLGQCPTGVYIVRVINGNETQSFKVFKK